MLSPTNDNHMMNLSFQCNQPLSSSGQPFHIYTNRIDFYRALVTHSPVQTDLKSPSLDWAVNTYGVIGFGRRQTRLILSGLIHNFLNSNKKLLPLCLPFKMREKWRVSKPKSILRSSYFATRVRVECFAFIEHHKISITRPMKIWCVCALLFGEIIINYYGPGMLCFDHTNQTRTINSKPSVLHLFRFVFLEFFRRTCTFLRTKNVKYEAIYV